MKRITEIRLQQILLEEFNILGVIKMDETPQPGFIYRHYKGNTYKVLHVAQDVNHSEIQWVIYQSNADPEGKVWARELKDFTEILGSPGSHFYRFERVS